MGYENVGMHHSEAFDLKAICNLREYREYREYGWFLWRENERLRGFGRLCSKSSRLL